MCKGTEACLSLSQGHFPPWMGVGESVRLTEQSGPGLKGPRPSPRAPGLHGLLSLPNRSSEVKNYILISCPGAVALAWLRGRVLADSQLPGTS